MKFFTLTESIKNTKFQFNTFGNEPWWEQVGAVVFSCAGGNGKGLFAATTPVVVARTAVRWYCSLVGTRKARALLVGG